VAAVAVAGEIRVTAEAVGAQAERVPPEILEIREARQTL